MALTWETFSEEGIISDDDEALSLSDLPIEFIGSQEKECKSPEAVEEFEFRVCGSGVGFPLKEFAEQEPDMCIADDIFFRGQLLPLRASFDSRSCYDLQSNPSSGFGESRSHSSISSSSCSSSCISRSQSCSSHSSNSDLPQRQSTSNKFYAHPSPRPQVIRRTKINPGRKSTGTGTTLPGWIGVLRLGVVKVPEIEINDLRSRRMRVKDSKCNGAKVNKPVPRFAFGCKCVPDVIEPVAVDNPTQPLVEKKKKKKKKEKLERRESSSRSSRVFEWLEELSIGKV